MEQASYVPIILVGFINFHLALSLLNESLIHTFRVMSRVEWLIVMSTVLVVAVFGFSYCIGYGMVLALGSWSYHHWTDRRNRPDDKDGKREPRTIVEFLQDRFTVLHINVPHLTFYNRNAIFSSLIGAKSSVLVDSIAGSASDESNEKCYYFLVNGQAFESFLLIDFGRVESMDFSSLSELSKVIRLLRQHNVQTLLVGLTEKSSLVVQMYAANLFRLEHPSQRGSHGNDSVDEEPPVYYFEDATEALHWQEEDALEQNAVGTGYDCEDNGAFTAVLIE